MHFHQFILSVNPNVLTLTHRFHRLHRWMPFIMSPSNVPYAILHISDSRIFIVFFFLLHRNLFNNKFVRIRLRHCQMLTCCQIYTKCALHFNKFKYSWIICNDDNKYSEPFKLRIFRLGGKKQPNPWHEPSLANLVFMEYRHSHGVARDRCNAKYAKYGPAQSSVYRSLSLSSDHLCLIPMDVPYIPLHEVSLNGVRGTNHE